MTRRSFSKGEKTILLLSVGLFVVLCGSVAVVVLTIEMDAQRNMPEIQSALDQACGEGVVQAKREHYSWEFASYYSPQADCYVTGRGGYRCDCKLTVTPTTPVSIDTN